MRLSRIRIQNFRCIKDAEIELGTTTVFIGPNNAGKTAILDAARIALTRLWGQRGTGFTEYDVHLPDESSDPKASDPVTIELELREETAGDWPADLQSDLQEIIQVDPIAGTASIIMRVSCAWDTTTLTYVPKWEFLNVARKPLTGKGARATNAQEFFQFLPVFYLAALRDTSDQFSERSPFWGRLLRTVQIPKALEQRAQRIFNNLNTKLLASDTRLSTLADTLSNVSRVAEGDQPGSATLRIMPLRPWDLLSRSEVIYRCEDGRPWLPLTRHGQGTQSLSVIFLFKAFVEQLLPELYKPDAAPVLALEEPETHLHPQAARSLWTHVRDLPGQKLVTTHSPFFLQRVPFRDLRIIRLKDGQTTVSSLPKSFAAIVPHVPGLDGLISKYSTLLRYDRAFGRLVVNGALTEDSFRELLTVFAGHADRVTIHSELRRVKTASEHFVSDEELDQLETFARRIRGEIFFATRWLLVEGHSEYHIFHGLATGLGYRLDEHGVSVIDFQNTGNPSSFAALARALGIPWLMVVDGDGAGDDFISRVTARCCNAADIPGRCRRLTHGNLEQQLVASGLGPELRVILAGLGYAGAADLDDHHLVETLANDKTGYAAVLGRQCAGDATLAARMPTAMVTAVSDLRGLN